jgi:hypothetical protein
LRRPLLALAAIGSLAAAGCGDDKKGAAATTATVTVTQTAPAPPTATVPATTASTATAPASNRCPDVALSPNSGHGAFDITVANISCAEAAVLLRSDSGLRSWRCRVIASAPGRQTTSCSSGRRAIVFATEA